MNKTAETEAEIHPLIASRWSPRAFDAQRQVEPGKLRAVLEAARWAPSCFGDEPWRYIVFDRFRDEVAWSGGLACLAEKNRLWAKHVPVLLLACAATEFRNGKPNRWGEYDTGAASENLCLQATALGLAAHQMGGFDGDAARRLLGIPANYTPMAMIAVGYPGEPEILEEAFRDAEVAGRQRRAAAEMLFSGRWGHPLTE